MVLNQCKHEKLGLSGLFICTSNSAPIQAMSSAVSRMVGSLELLTLSKKSHFGGNGSIIIRKIPLSLIPTYELISQCDERIKKIVRALYNAVSGLLAIISRAYKILS